MDTRSLRFESKLTIWKPNASCCKIKSRRKKKRSKSLVTKQGALQVMRRPKTSWREPTIFLSNSTSDSKMEGATAKERTHCSRSMKQWWGSYRMCSRLIQERLLNLASSQDWKMKWRMICKTWFRTHTAASKMKAMSKKRTTWQKQKTKLRKMKSI